MRSLSSFRDPALHATHSPRAGDPSRSVQPDRASHTMFHRVSITDFRTDWLRDAVE